MASLLDVQDLSISLPRLDPVRNLSFSINARETLALVGESGSGKSLTALALLRLLPSQAAITGGRILFDGEDLLGLAPEALRRLRGRDIAMVFQEPMTSLNPVLSIGRQITEVLRRHQGLSRRAARQRAIELLDLVRISEPDKQMDAFPHQLSGGMRQRVMIAMAVACSPKLLIADEPTTALDVTIQAQVLHLLDQLRHELGMALLLITHDLGLVGEWADRVVVMYAGRKVEEADAASLFSAPYHPYTRGLLAASPRMSAEAHYSHGPLVEIEGSILSATAEKGCAFAPRCALSDSRCRSAVPALSFLAPGHGVACPLVSDCQPLEVLS